MEENFDFEKFKKNFEKNNYKNLSLGIVRVEGKHYDKKSNLIFLDCVVLVDKDKFEDLTFTIRPQTSKYIIRAIKDSLEEKNAG